MNPPRHCTDLEENRRIGAFWEAQFCTIAKGYGHVFTPHQYGKDRIAACAYSATGRIILPDMTIWSGPGEHHEVKHKNPTGRRQFGLEAYRLESLVAFESLTGEPVYYTIHNWEARGRDSKENRIEDWYTCQASTLWVSRGQPRLEDTWCGGEVKRLPIYFWAAMYFKPLALHWRKPPRAECQ